MPRLISYSIFGSFFGTFCLMAPAFGQPPIETADAVEEALTEALAAAMAAIEGTSDQSSEQLQAERDAKIEEVHSSMRLISEDPDLANRLPIPAAPASYEVTASLEHDSAWINGSAQTHKSEFLLELTEATGSVLYFEWACNTGKYNSSAKRFLEFLPTQITPFPERMLIKRALLARDFHGFDSDRACSPKELELSRLRQSELVKELSL